MIKKIQMSIVTAFFVFSGTIDAAEQPEIGEFYGGVVGIQDIFEVAAEDDPTAMERLIRMPKPATTYAVTPALVFADGADISGASFDIGYLKVHGFQFRALNISPDVGDSIMQYRGSYKYTLPASKDPLSYAASMRFVDTENSHKTLELLGLVEHKFKALGKRMVASGNIKWRSRSYDSSAVSDEDALGGAAGVAAVLSSEFVISVDYDLEDNINNDDTLSATAIYSAKIAGSDITLIGGVDDDETITLAAKYRF